MSTHTLRYKLCVNDNLMKKRAVYLFVTKDFYKLNAFLLVNFMALKTISTYTYVQSTFHVVVINVIKSDNLL